MSLEQNGHEGGPGAFLSLCDRTLSTSSSLPSSPLKAHPPAAKEEQGALGTCLSLQQPHHGILRDEQHLTTFQEHTAGLHSLEGSCEHQEHSAKFERHKSSLSQDKPCPVDTAQDTDESAKLPSSGLQTPTAWLGSTSSSFVVSSREESLVEVEHAAAAEREKMLPLEPTLGSPHDTQGSKPQTEKQGEQGHRSSYCPLECVPFQAIPEDQKGSFLDGSLQQQKSAFLRGHMLHGSFSQTVGILKSDEQSHPECFGVEQKRVSVSQEQLGASHSRAIMPGQGDQTQSASSVLPDRGGLLCTEPIVAQNPIDQADLLNERGCNPPNQSPGTFLSSPQGAELIYPIPLATHEAVLADQGLFIETLKRLHAALGMNVSLPSIPGSSVDLHKLYKEVTCRGGLEKVTQAGKWEEVAVAVGFPLSASFVLRRSYINALYHYEQVHLFGAHGRVVSLPAADVEDRGKGMPDLAQAIGSQVDPASSVGVTGAIDGKFEDGYLVTVMVGARKMRGVLYHASPTNILPRIACTSISTIPSTDSGWNPADLHGPQVGQRRKKREIFRKDPNAPRQNRTGYNFFFAEQRAKLKTMQPDKDRAISKKIGESWGRLSEDEKIPYQVKGIKDKERYLREMKEYKEKIKVPKIESSNERPSVPAQPSYAYVSQPLNAVPPLFTMTYMSECSTGSKPVLDEVPTVMTSPAAFEVKAMPPQAPLRFMPEASNALLVKTQEMVRSSEQEPLLDKGANASSTAACTSTADTVGSTLSPFPVVSDLSRALAVSDTSGHFVHEKSPNSAQ